MPTTISAETLLLVEGNDHRNFFEAFSKHLGISQMNIEDFGGVSQLSEYLSALVKSREFARVRRLGIVRDAEDSARSAFQSVCSALGKANRALSELDRANLVLPDTVGIVADGCPAVSVLVVPDDGAGMLETVLAGSFAGTREDNCIDRFFECVYPDGRKMQRRPEKARTTAYLATTPDPHVSVGVAAKKRVWDFDHDAFRKIREFLSRLGSA